MKDLIRHLERAWREVEEARCSANGYDGFGDLKLIAAEVKNLLQKAREYYD